MTQGTYPETYQRMKYLLVALFTCSLAVSSEKSPEPIPVVDLKIVEQQLPGCFQREVRVSNDLLVTSLIRFERANRVSLEFKGEILTTLGNGEKALQTIHARVITKKDLGVSIGSIVISTAEHEFKTGQAIGVSEPILLRPVWLGGIPEKGKESNSKIFLQSASWLTGAWENNFYEKVDCPKD